MIACILALTAGCGPMSTAVLAPDPCAAVQGAPSAMTLRPGQHDLHGFTLVVQQLGSPREPDFLLAVRGPSVRRLTAPRESTPRCTVPPAPDDPCELVSVDDLMWEIIERTRAREGHVDVRHSEALVHEWAHVDRAAVAIADTLRAWRIASPFLLRVQRPKCATLEAG